jgi:DNA-binding transcriptional ArsR family regulator
LIPRAWVRVVLDEDDAVATEREGLVQRKRQSRFRALAPELCVCDLALLLDRSVSALSHQLRLLRERGAVTRRKAGRIAFYSFADEHVRHVLDNALAHTAEPASQTA